MLATRVMRISNGNKMVLKSHLLIDEKYPQLKTEKDKRLDA